MKFDTISRDPLKCAYIVGKSINQAGKLLYLSLTPLSLLSTLHLKSTYERDGYTDSSSLIL